jgi:hypothetical protein
MWTFPSLQESRATEGTGQRLPDVIRWDGVVERRYDFVIKDHEIFKSGWDYDPIAT